MNVNILLFVIGLIILIYGIKNKIRFVIIASLIIIGISAASAAIDFALSGTDDAANINARVPVAVERLVK